MTATADRGDAPSRYAVFVLALLTLANISNYVDRMVVAVLAQPLKEAFQATDSQMGLLSGPAFSFVYAFAGVFLAWFADRHSRKLVLGISVIGWSLMTMASGASQDFTQLILTRAAMGFFQGAALPTAYALIADYYVAQRRPQAVATYSIGAPVGMLLVFAVTGMVAANLGWRAAFYIAGASGVLIGVWVLLALKDAKDRPDAAAPVSAEAAAAPKEPRPVRALARNQVYIWLVMGTAFGSFANSGILQWLPAFYMRVHDMSVQSIGLIFGPTFALAMALGISFAGWLGTRGARVSASRPLAYCGFALLAAIPLSAVSIWAPDLRVALVGNFFANAVSVMYAPIWAAALQGTTQPSVRSTASAIALLGSGLVGQGASPWIVGVVSDALTPVYGENALRWALSGVGVVFVGIGSLSFFMAMRAIRRQAAAQAV